MYAVCWRFISQDRYYAFRTYRYLGCECVHTLSRHLCVVICAAVLLHAVLSFSLFHFVFFIVVFAALSESTW